MLTLVRCEHVTRVHMQVRYAQCGAATLQQTMVKVVLGSCHMIMIEHDMTCTATAAYCYCQLLLLPSGV